MALAILFFLATGFCVYFFHPPNRFAAEFLGRANLLPVRLEARDPDGRLARVGFGPAILRARAHPDIAVGARCLLCVRPHDLSLGSPGGSDNVLAGHVQSALWQGDQHHIAVMVGETVLRLASPPLAEPPPPGAPLRLHFRAGNATLIPDDDR